MISTPEAFGAFRGRAFAGHAVADPADFGGRFPADEGLSSLGGRVAGFVGFGVNTDDVVCGTVRASVQLNGLLLLYVMHSLLCV